MKKMFIRSLVLPLAGLVFVSCATQLFLQDTPQEEFIKQIIKNTQVKVRYEILSEIHPEYCFAYDNTDFLRIQIGNAYNNNMSYYLHRKFSHCYAFDEAEAYDYDLKLILRRFQFFTFYNTANDPAQTAELCLYWSVQKGDSVLSQQEFIVEGITPKNRYTRYMLMNDVLERTVAVLDSNLVALGL